MNKIIKLLLPIIKIIVVVAQNLATQKSYRNLIKKLLSYGGAIFFLISSYIFACIALYYFLLPYCGEALAALSICLLFLIISFGLIMIGRGSKPQKKDSSPLLLSHLENYFGSMPDSQDLMKALKKASPQILATVLGGLAITAVVKIFKKKE